MRQGTEVVALGAAEFLAAPDARALAVALRLPEAFLRFVRARVPNLSDGELALLRRCEWMGPLGRLRGLTYDRIFRREGLLRALQLSPFGSPDMVPPLFVPDPRGMRLLRRDYDAVIRLPSFHCATVPPAFLRGVHDMGAYAVDCTAPDGRVRVRHKASWRCVAVEVGLDRYACVDPAAWHVYEVWARAMAATCPAHFVHTQ